MRTLNLKQGEPGWHAHRATARNASDAPAAAGCSPYTTRSELLHQRHTGIRPEVEPAVQRRFDDGHAIEAYQRTGAEQIIGEPLYPVVGVAEVDGIELSASFDGITMAEDVIYECKTINDELRTCLPNPFPDDNDGSDLPKHYRLQMEQQLAVAGAERVLFVAASKDGAEVRRCWYYPDTELRRELIAAWRQFDADLATYVPPAPSAVEKIVAEPVEALPAPVVQVSGQITLQDNFRVFEERLRHFLDHRLIRQPKTDQDFADLDVQIKAMKQAEAALDAAEGQMLAQIQTVDQAKKTKDMLAKLVRDNRLMAEKLLASEKERRRGDIVAAGVKALADHIAGLNARLGKPYMPQIPADFGGCIKGMKSLASMEDKVATELARAKIAANEAADRIDLNLRHLREHGAEFKHLFPDTAAIVLKAPEDLQALVAARIAEHRAAEERRLEAERARIRAEEEARARAQAQAEQAAREAEERRQEQEKRRQEVNAAGTAAMESIAAAREADDLPAPLLDELEEAASGLIADLTLSRVADNVRPMPTRAPAAPAGPPTLRLGQINDRLGFTVTADFLASIGFPVVATDKAAKLWHEHQFHGICAAIAQHVVSVANAQKAA